MKEIKFQDKTIRIYSDPMEFVNMEKKPLGDIPEGAEFIGLDDGSKSSGFVGLDDKIIRLYVGLGCEFIDLFSTVSHELGHLIEGGFKKNPPHKYFNKHEAKAEHYENFALDCYMLTNLIIDQLPN